MAKKRTEKVPAVAEERVIKPIRLDLTERDHARLVQCAEERGLSNAAYSRQAVLERIKADEGGR